MNKLFILLYHVTMGGVALALTVLLVLVFLWAVKPGVNPLGFIVPFDALDPFDRDGDRIAISEYRRVYQA